MENGFVREEFVIDEKRLKGLLKNLLKKEFPRSNKIRPYALGEYSPGVEATVGRRRI